MSVSVIGAGFGRTGTLSLKGALEQLGFGPCYHMMVVLDRPEHSKAWYRTSRGTPIEWSLYDSFQSVLDWPSVAYWRDLVERYSSAKVVLTLRDAESWYKSVSETIYRRVKTPLPPNAPDARRLHRAMVTKIVFEDTFGGRFEDERHAINVFERHNESVRATVEPSRLLVFNVKEGWEPLCRFLGVAVPDDPFPRLNDTNTFQAWSAQDDLKP
jgi:Sulfotransferase domain